MNEMLEILMPKVQNQLFNRPVWSVQGYGIDIKIDEYENMPTATLISIDLETNGKEVTDENFRIVCVGLYDGISAYIYFDIHDSLIRYLHQTSFLAHNGKGAEIPWLNKVYGGFSMDQLVYDTQIMAYVFDSSRKKYHLKGLIEEKIGIKYPTYEELTTNKNFIEQSCKENNDLYILKDRKPTKKDPSVCIAQHPKKLTLDQMPQKLVAEYNACDVYWTWKLWEWYKEHFNAKQWNFLNTIEMPTTRLIYEMEQKGIKIDTKAVRRIHNETSKTRRKIKKELDFLSKRNSTNYNSPKQVLEMLQLFGINCKSTGEEVLIQFRSQPLVSKLLEYREKQKLCSTYTIPLYFNAIKDLENRIHARFNQNTITGRLSSSDPINLQNQPQAVRQCFIAKEGYQFVNADFSNIELRLPAHFSGEKGFITELSKPSGDLHSCTARFLFGERFSQVDQETYKEMRQKAKTCNFLLTNSGTASRLSSELGCSEKEGLQLFQSFWQGYPTLCAWLKEEKFQARKNGGIETYFGRWVNIPQLRILCSIPSRCGKGMTCHNCIIREEAERSSISIRVQGTAADLIKLSMLRLYNEYGLIPNLSIHDEINYEVKEDEAIDIAKVVKSIMENIIELNVPLIADVGIGKTWALAKGK